MLWCMRLLKRWSTDCVINCYVDVKPCSNGCALRHIQYLSLILHNIRRIDDLWMNQKLHWLPKTYSSPVYSTCMNPFDTARQRRPRTLEDHTAVRACVHMTSVSLMPLKGDGCASERDCASSAKCARVTQGWLNCLATSQRSEIEDG